MPEKPTTIFFSITWACPLRCKVCSIWRLNEPSDSLTKNERLTVIEQLKGFNQPVHVEVTGGEPFTKCNELLEIASAQKKIGGTVGVVTNGYLLSPNVVKKLEGSGITHIAFSIDFPTSFQHDTQRGMPNTFHNATEAIKLLVKMKEQGLDVPTVGIDSIVMEQNINYLEDIAALAANLNVHEFLLQPIQPDFGLSDQVGLSKFRYWLPADLKKVTLTLDRIEKMRGAAPLGQSKVEFSKLKEYFTNPLYLANGTCYSPQRNLVIDITGQVLHCFGQARTGLKPLGRVPKDNIVNLWESEKAKANRKYLSKCHHGCGALLCHGRDSSRGVLN